MLIHVCSVQFSLSVVSDSLWPRGLQHARLPRPWPTPGARQSHVHWLGDAIQPSHPLSSPSPAFNLSQYQGLFQWVSSSHQVTKVLELQLQNQSFHFRADFLQDWLIPSHCSPRDFQKPSPTPQFRSISSLVLNFLTLTSQDSVWKNRNINLSTKVCLAKTISFQ